MALKEPLPPPATAPRPPRAPSAPAPSTAGIVPTPSAVVEAAAAALDSEEISALLAYATDLIGASRIVADGTSFRKDCSGFVRACYYSQGLDLFDVGKPGRSGTESIYNYVKHNGRVYTRGTPQPGDIVFFHNTYDRNRNGRRDDLFTHVALVEGVDRADTVTLIHVLNQGIIRSRMNLRHRDLHQDPRSKAVLNDYLRRADSRHSAKLTAHLFFSYGRLF